MKKTTTSFKYFLESFDSESPYWLKKDAIPKSLQNIKLLTGKRILDLGCGGGRLIKSLSNTQSSLHGIDASPELIKLAKLENPEINYICGNFQSPATWSNIGIFDAIISNCSLRKDYCSNLARVAKLCKEHLSKEGKLILRVQAFEDLESILPAGLRQNLFYNEKEIRNHLSIFGKIKIDHEIYKQKFSSEEYLRKFLARINIKYNGPIKDLNPERHYYITK
jgi:2-polyprenyl-3-methyl-5-hydroxy-6-metoxy-1,4-benzoquinol methylase